MFTQATTADLENAAPVTADTPLSIGDEVIITHGGMQVKYTVDAVCPVSYSNVSAIRLLHPDGTSAGWAHKDVISHKITRSDGEK